MCGLLLESKDKYQGTLISEKPPLKGEKLKRVYKDGSMGKAP